MNYQAQDTSEADIVVIGGGPGGYVAAIRAAQLGAKVYLIEKEKLGGVCTNRGCIPSKALLRNVQMFSPLLGCFEDLLSFNIKAAMERKTAIVEALVKSIETLLKRNRIKIIYGLGKIKARNTVTVDLKDGQRTDVKGKNIIIATGSTPTIPSIPGIDGSNVVTTDQALELLHVPESVLIIGGGPIGLEFSFIFKGMGSRQIILVEMMPNILPSEDEEVTSQMKLFMQNKGMTVLTNAKVLRISDGTDQKKTVLVSTIEGEQEFYVDIVLVAAGRTPQSNGLGLEKIGVDIVHNRIPVNAQMQTNTPGVFAVGDVVSKLMLAHVAMAEGVVAAENAMGVPSAIDYSAIPRCVYTDPELAFVGLSEKDARGQFGNVNVGRFPLFASGRAVTIGETTGIIKIVSDGVSGRILGVHMMAPYASELIHECALAIKLKATIDDFASVVHAHPTLAEAVREAVLDTKGGAIHILRHRPDPLSKFDIV